MKYKTLLKIGDWYNAIKFLIIAMGTLGGSIYAIYHSMYGDLKSEHEYDIYMYMGSITLFIGLMLSLFILPEFIRFIRNQ